MFDTYIHQTKQSNSYAIEELGEKIEATGEQIAKALSPKKKIIVTISYEEYEFEKANEYRAGRSEGFKNCCDMIKKYCETGLSKEEFLRRYWNPDYMALFSALSTPRGWASSEP